MKALEITGRRFNRLIVLRKVVQSAKHSKWLCRCDCGKEKIIYGISLTRGDTKSCGCLFKELLSERSRKLVKNLTKLKFGRLTVESRNLERQILLKSKAAYWNCVCECGNKKIICGGSLRHKSSPTLSCGCLRKDIAIIRNRNKKLPNAEAGFNELFGHYQYNARKKNRIFNLTKDDFRKLIKNDCYYCGVKPANMIKNPTGNFVYNGIDRMNNTLGYELSNCVSCCYVCNKSKMEMDHNSFKIQIKKIYEHLNLAEFYSCR